MPFVGPFTIKTVLERDRYELVGRGNARRDHHEFHVSRLKLWPQNADDDDIYLGEDYYDVDFVVDHKVDGQGTTLYRVRWVGYGAKDDCWLPLTAMNGACATAAYEYMQEHAGDIVDDNADNDNDNDASDGVAADAGADIDDGIDADADAGTSAGVGAEDDAVQPEPTPIEGVSEEPATQAPASAAKSDSMNERDARRAARDERMGKAGAGSSKARMLRELENSD